MTRNSPIQLNKNWYFWNAFHNIYPHYKYRKWNITTKMYDHYTFPPVHWWRGGMCGLYMSITIQFQETLEFTTCETRPIVRDNWLGKSKLWKRWLQFLNYYLRCWTSSSNQYVALPKGEWARPTGGVEQLVVWIDVSDTAGSLSQSLQYL